MTTQDGPATNSSPSVSAPRPALTAARAVGAVVGPASLIAALTYFFGRLHATAFFSYLGVHFTAFDLTPVDYVIRSQDGLFVPVALAGAGVLTVLWGRRMIVPRLPARIRRVVRRCATPLAASIGIAGVGTATLAILDPAQFREPVALPGLALTAGVLALAYAAHSHDEERSPGTAAAEWAAIYIVASVGLFWAVANSSSTIGTSRAQQLELILPDRPEVVVISEKPLALAGVPVRRCSDNTGYRYSGLVLVLQAGGQYLFLPRGWRHTDGTAILLPRSEGLRLEFRGPAAAPLVAAC